MNVDPDRLSPAFKDEPGSSALPKDAPKLGREETILQAASKQMDDNTDPAADTLARSAARTSAHSPVYSSSKGAGPKKNRKKIFIGLGVVLLLAGAIAAGMLLFRKPDSSPAPAKDNSGSTDSATTTSFEPDTVAYAYRANTSDPFTVYYRPAAGGERQEVMKLERDEHASVSHTVRNVVVFGSATKLYASQDAGKTYRPIYSSTAGEVINSVKISSDGDRIAVAVTSDFGDQAKGSVFSIDLNGKDKKELFTDDSTLFLIGWSNKRQKIAYWQGCYGCDGGYSGWKLRDLKTKTAEDLVEGVDPNTFYPQAAISDDMFTLMYVQATYDANITVEGPPGYYSGAPYKILKADLSTGQSTLVATIGQKEEKNPNGTIRMRAISVGFLAGTKTGYYAESSGLYKVTGDQPSLLYRADQDISAVHFASDKSIIVSTGELSSSDFSLSAYDIAAKKSTQIFQGDANTSLFGATTK